MGRKEAGGGNKEKVGRGLGEKGTSMMPTSIPATYSIPKAKLFVKRLCARLLGNSLLKVQKPMRTVAPSLRFGGTGLSHFGNRRIFAFSSLCLRRKPNFFASHPRKRRKAAMRNARYDLTAILSPSAPPLPPPPTLFPMRFHPAHTPHLVPWFHGLPA